MNIKSEYKHRNTQTHNTHHLQARRGFFCLREGRLSGPRRVLQLAYSVSPAQQDNGLIIEGAEIIGGWRGPGGRAGHRGSRGAGRSGRNIG